MKPARAIATALAAALFLLAAGLAGPAVAQNSAQPSAPNATPEQRNTRHALIIGIGDYLDPAVPPLKGVKHDLQSARRMAHAMAIPDANIRVLSDRDATADRIRAEIEGLYTRMADGDRLFIYYSGHGTRWYDARSKQDECTEGLMATDGQVLTNAELGQRLTPLARRADKMLVFYDACFSGGIAGSPFRARSLTVAGEQVVPKFTRVGAPEQCSRPSNFKTRSLSTTLQQQQALAENVVHVAASRPDEVSFDSSTQGGFATTAWRDCLLGDAKDTDHSGAVTADEVTACAQAKVTTALAGHPGILGQRMTVAGNPKFVPAWIGAAFGPAAAAAPAPVATPVAAPAPAAATPAQVLAELHSQRDGQRRVTATARKDRLTIGRDPLQIDVTPSRDGYLYVALAGSDGTSLYLLYPNDLAKDNRVRAGQPLSLPGKGWEIVAGGPAGMETLLVMVTDAPRDLKGLAQEKSGPFMKTLLDGNGRARLQWVLSNGTPAAGCGKPGAPSCSDAFGAALLNVQSVP